MDSSFLDQINEILLSDSDEKSTFKNIFQIIGDNGNLHLISAAGKAVYTSLIISDKHEDIIEKLNCLKNNQNAQGVFKLIWNIEEVQKYFIGDMNISRKSAITAAEFRKEGNDHYQNNDFAKALERYNLSIIASPHPQTDSKDLSNEDSDLGMGYASRSGILFELKQYEKCVADINRALQYGYPKHLHFNLIERKIKCYFSLGKIKDVQECITYLEEINLNGMINTSKHDWISKLREQYDTCKITNLDSPTPQPKNYSSFESKSQLTDSELIFSYTKPNPPQLSSERHPDILGFSNILKLDHSTQKGRFVVTERDIKPGEVLAVDSAYVSCVNMDDQSCVSNFCCHCMERCVTPIPCLYCSMVAFCGEKCRELAWDKFHKAECGVLSSILTLGYPDSESFIEAYRTVVQIPFDTLKSILIKFKENDEETSRTLQGFNRNLKYDSSNYTTIYHLEGNLQARDALQLLELCGFACALTKLLIKNGKYFISEKGVSFEPSMEDIVLIGSTLLSHILSIHCNCIGINETQINVENLTFCSSKTKLVGTAVFPAISLFNHSCNPSAMVYSYGNIAVCYSVRFIPAGGEITLKYGKFFYEERDVEVRRSHLLQEYFFTCYCDACAQDWQMVHFSRKLKPKLRSPLTRLAKKQDVCILSYINLENGISSEILLESELDDIIKDDNRAAMDLRRPWYNPENILETALKTIEFFDRYVILPDITYTRAQVLLTEFLKITRPCNFFR
ncbi:unnamed protein product [Meganyctiphanes norvegica]|uniref:Protein-lysine N-methyltransferase SMYD4 n=1 Tax=Meganyctiphanes norvegica TaxID=48144 RepID=A0AAV2Q0W7_MEGNR